MSAEPSTKANSLDDSQSGWYLLIYLLSWASYLTVVCFVLWPCNPWCAVILWGTFAVGPVVAASALSRRVPWQWFRVPTGERTLHRILGVGIFGWLLDVSGWNRHAVEPRRGFSGKRAGLPSLEQWVRASAVYHGICFAIHVLLTVLALFSRHPWSGALWMLLPGVVVHLYPVLLQRSLMLRLQPLLDRTE